MANHKVEPEPRTCPVCGAVFEVGGRGRRRRDSIYCSLRCLNLTRSGRAPHAGSHAPRPRVRLRATVRDQSWLRARYVDDRLTMDQVADMAGCTRQSVWRAMHDFGIQVRSTAETMPRKVRPRGPVRSGISLTDYQALSDAQGGLCAACGQPETKAHRNGTVLRLAVDHDHATGKVRALLCSRCNYSLGYARDDVAVLHQLIAYLERHST